jgi:glycosyltransferase involved in cell wall biosynthesis
MTDLTYPKEKFEVIVIDDASIDRTGEKAKMFAQNHSFMRVVHRDPAEGGKGKPEALNCGLKHVSGEIIYCFDADYYARAAWVGD